MDPVSLTEAAKQLGVHKSTLSRQVAAGIIPNRGEPGGAPMVNVDEARVARTQGLDRSKQRGDGAPLFSAAIAVAAAPDDDEPAAPAKGGVQYQQARTAREGFQARLAQIELEKQLGNLVDKGELVDAFFTMGQRQREILEASVVDLTARFGDQVGAAIREEYRKVMQATAEDFERRFAPPAKDNAT